MSALAASATVRPVALKMTAASFGRVAAAKMANAMTTVPMSFLMVAPWVSPAIRHRRAGVELLRLAQLGTGRRGENQALPADRARRLGRVQPLLQRCSRGVAGAPDVGMFTFAHGQRR